MSIMYPYWDDPELDTLFSTDEDGSIPTEHEGITLTIDPTGWPKNLAGVRIGSKCFYINRDENTIDILCDPIWDASTSIGE
jgi:hypothetical protein